ncbi:uncharacterized protein LOC119283920 [Triticum dicoccoides]|uniref:uncharacterized protein LOC119283920 n=1 Tax=Triticum dicoccoides TaxID=85692 RepID=UPI00188DD799|nr:uncharacterized protein LOC119283920 [Triticum dicoccoides]
MRIRRCASRLLGSAAAAPAISCSSAEPPRFELPPLAPPAPAHESRPGFVAPEASSCGEPCCELSRSPWDLMDQLDLSDPQVEKLFEETHFRRRPAFLLSGVVCALFEHCLSIDFVFFFVRAPWMLFLAETLQKVQTLDEACCLKDFRFFGPCFITFFKVLQTRVYLHLRVATTFPFRSVTWRSSWLFLPSMPAFGSIKEDQAQEDMSDEVELHIAAKKTAREKNERKLKKNKGVKLKKGVWTCRKNDGKGWFCRRLTREPNSYCSYHSDQKLKPPGSEKPHRKRAPVNVGEEFYYYAGFGPGTKRCRTSSSDSVPEPPLPAEPLKEEAPSEMQLDFSAGQAQANKSDHQAVLPPSAHVADEPTLNDGTARIRSDGDVPEPPLPAEPPEEETLKEEAPPEMQLNFSAGQAQADGSDYQAALVSVSVVNKPTRNNGTACIAGWDEESSNDDMLGRNGEQPRDITKRKSPLKKRWRKPVKARSLKSLML